MSAFRLARACVYVVSVAMVICTWLLYRLFRALQETTRGHTHLRAACEAARQVLRGQRYFGGGGGGGGIAPAPNPNSGNSVTGAQPAAPGRHACVVGATWPFCTIVRKASSV